MQQSYQLMLSEHTSACLTVRHTALGSPSTNCSDIWHLQVIINNLLISNKLQAYVLFLSVINVDTFLSPALIFNLTL
jgi:hypothetical protein